MIPCNNPFTDSVKSKIRPIRVEAGVAYVPLTRGRVAIVDAADVPLISGRSWQCTSQGYAASGQKSNKELPRCIYMHRLIMKAPNDMEVDHIDGDPLNNRRANLRLATHRENMHNSKKPAHNTSGFKGVCWNARVGKWLAYIKFQGQRKYLGNHETALLAHAAYCKAASELHGEFARLR